MEGYTKLFSSIIASTIWRESHQTRIVWVTMLAMANKHGHIWASVPGLADMARVTIDECMDALKALMSPDEWSRTKDYEGRRIEEIDGGWRILNHAKYREKMSKDEIRERKRMWDQEHRNRKSDAVSDKIRQNPTNPTHTEAEAYTEAEANTVNTNTDTRDQIPDTMGITPPLSQPLSPPLTHVARKRASETVSYTQDFETFWKAYPKGKGKQPAFKAWKNIKNPVPTLESMLQALSIQIMSFEWQKEEGRFIPHCATWINQRRWEDEVKKPQPIQQVSNNKPVLSCY